MKVLFIGGTGVISSACSRLAVESGIELYLLNRGNASRSLPENVKVLKADIRNVQQVKKVIKPFMFDVVVDWLAFETQHIQTDIDLFSDMVKQFVFISSASVYETPKVLPVNVVVSAR